MRFAAIVLTTGFLGILFAANIQGAPALSAAEAAAVITLHAAPGNELDPMETAGIATNAKALRLIDLRSGTTCRSPSSPPLGIAFAEISLSGGCIRSPVLSRVSRWRSTESGSLVMTDGDGATVLEFAPGDGVLFESVYPADQLITIVPSRG